MLWDPRFQISLWFWAVLPIPISTSAGSRIFKTRRYHELDVQAAKKFAIVLLHPARRVEEGTLGLDLLSRIENGDRTLIIDEVEFGREPGYVDISGRKALSALYQGMSDTEPPPRPPFHVHANLRAVPYAYLIVV